MEVLEQGRAPDAVGPQATATTPANANPSATQTALVTAASRMETSSASRWKTNKSIVSMARITATTATHAQMGTSMDWCLLRLICCQVSRRSPPPHG
ncbi:MAG: hypothetical protein ACRD12_08420 [Acidimicrobiales bacterium]